MILTFLNFWTINYSKMEDLIKLRYLIIIKIKPQK
jgi:hypothetical protein